MDTPGLLHPPEDRAAAVVVADAGVGPKDRIAATVVGDAGAFAVFVTSAGGDRGQGGETDNSGAEKAGEFHVSN